MPDAETIRKSSENAVADPGLPDPEVRMAKAKLAQTIGKAIQRAGWTQMRAAGALGIDQPRTSKITTGKLAGFSIERLVEPLNRADYDVAITVSPAARKSHATTVAIEGDLPSAALG